MFVDLSGYTAMSTTLDAEDTHQLLNRFFEVVDGIILDFGGTIDKHKPGAQMPFESCQMDGKLLRRAPRTSVAIENVLGLTHADKQSEEQVEGHRNSGR